VVVSGGGRGVTAACTAALAQASPGACFVLLGRSALADEPERLRGLDDAALARALGPELPQPAALRERVQQIKAAREIRRTLEAVRRAGATAVYEAADVADARAVAAALDRVRAQHGPITAVVHGAGVIADKPIAEKTDEQVDRVLRTKLAGLSALLDATSRDDLRALLLFSSIAGRTGNVGQCDYAMANATLDAVAAAEHQRRGGACVVKSLGWGPWDGGMVTPGLAAHFERLGVPLIPLEAGAAAFVAECLEAPPDQVDVLLGVSSATHAPGATRRPWEAAVLVHPSTHGFLRDHQLRGNVVVPVAMAIEWCARAAFGLRPDLVVTGLDDVNVLRGIKLGAFDDGTRPPSVTVLRVTADQVSNGEGARARVTIADLTERLHYRCEVSLEARPPGPGPTAAPPARALAAPSAPFGGRIYDGHALFHGPAFQVLEAIDGVDGELCSARLHGARFVDGWPEAGWETDPAAMDGALQLAVLWARERLGGAMLPSRVGHVRRYQPGLARTALRGVLERRDVQPTRVLSDVALVDAEGRLFAELRGVETHLRPDDK
jgi:NAD(P)-dependent dehydrogenase (short-subunit alcohol dehydrogenase family)